MICINQILHTLDRYFFFITVLEVLKKNSRKRQIIHLLLTDNRYKAIKI